MNNYLTLKKILKDCVSLYKTYGLYVTLLIGSVLGLYTLLISMDNLPSIFIIFVPIFLLLVMLVEYISTGLISTGYVEREFNIVSEIKDSYKYLFQYILITILGFAGTIMGVSLFIITGFIVNMFFNLIKVEYTNNRETIGKSFTETINHLKGGRFFKALKVQLFPILLQVILAVIISPYTEQLMSETIDMGLYVTMIVALVIIFPISICYRVALYFNTLKEEILDSSNQLV